MFCQMRQVDPISTQSLKLTTFIGDSSIANATGFIVRHNGADYLITNWHVVTGVDLYQGKKLDPLGRVPDNIRITYCSKVLGNWVFGVESLKGATGDTWKELKIDGKLIDVIALRLYHVPESAQIHYFDLDLDNTDIRTTVTNTVFVVGFPEGISSYGYFPIWKTGHIASDPDLDVYNDLPTFYIDATTRPGMSGSPVIYRSNSFFDKSGNMNVGVDESILFMGIYAGQIGSISIGLVFKASAIRRLLSAIP